MIPPLVKFIAWYALQCASGNSNLTEAIDFLNGPNFIPAESKPAALEFASDIHFNFPSQCLCEFPENNVVHGRLYRRAKDWQKCLTIILLHAAAIFWVTGMVFR